MPRKNPNISNYHYRVDTYNDKQEIILQKYYFTLNDVCEDFSTSSFTLYKLINDETYVPKSNTLKKHKFFKDKQPAFQKIQNSPIIQSN
tara:strand:+ start:1195 stop:1461 length:267 start_codon:yes stop_codon:yes gene_type:complete